MSKEERVRRLDGSVVLLDLNAGQEFPPLQPAIPGEGDLLWVNGMWISKKPPAYWEISEEQAQLWLKQEEYSLEIREISSDNYYPWEEIGGLVEDRIGAVANFELLTSLDEGGSRIFDDPDNLPMLSGLWIYRRRPIDILAEISKVYGAVRFIPGDAEEKEAGERLGVREFTGRQGNFGAFIIPMRRSDYSA